MEFKRKLKIRLNTAIIYIVLGLMIIMSAIIFKSENSFISPFGLALVVIGAARLKKHLIITKSDERIKKQEILEGDERNIAISTKAKSLSFGIYIILAGSAVIALSFMGFHNIATLISYSVCLLIAIYWIVYFIIRKKY